LRIKSQVSALYLVQGLTKGVREKRDMSKPERITETLLEALENKSKSKLSPQLIELKKCAGRAKTKLFQVKKAELTSYYLEECGKFGVVISKPGTAVIEGQPKGQERYKITMRARCNAQNKIRKEFYDLYLEFYNEELTKSGLKKDKTRWSSTDQIERLQAEVVRLEGLLSECRCRS
jgi:hypothetical protein